MNRGTTPFSADVGRPTSDQTWTRRAHRASWLTRAIATVAVAVIVALAGHGAVAAPIEPAWAEQAPDEAAPDEDAEQPDAPDDSDGSDNSDGSDDSGDSDGSGNSGDTGDTGESPDEQLPGDPLPGGPGQNQDQGLPEHCTREHGNTQLMGNHLPRTPWAQIQLQYDRVHEITTGMGTTVAVIDTGVQFNAHQLAPQAADEQSLARTKQAGGNSIVNDDGSSTTDCDGHGTFIAGLIAGQTRPTDNDFGGLAPDAAIYAGRYAQGQPDAPLDSGEEEEDEEAEQEPDGTIEDLAAAIYAAVHEDVDVINISSVATQDHSQLASAIQFAEARDVVVVAAAGNTAADGNPRTYPASYDSVLAVGAVDENGELAEFSQTSVPISVVAPGADVDGPATTEGLYTQGGTSFAAGFVSATAALLRSHEPELSAADVRQRIERTADNPGRNVPDTGYGWGYLNPHRALTTIVDEDDESAPPPTEQAGASYEPPPEPDTQPRDTALIIGASAAGFVLLMFLVIGTYRRGHKRGWRAGQNTASPAEPDPF